MREEEFNDNNQETMFVSCSTEGFWDPDRSSLVYGNWYDEYVANSNLWMAEY